MGLLRTAARVSVATRVHGNVRRRQENRWAAEDQAAAARAAAQAPVQAPPAPVAPPAPAAPAADAMSRQLEQLTQLGQLRAAGILTDAEFEAKKAIIMAS
ncbi:MAG: SHOCT domain-containing protein [Propionibacteriaceae bacterium]|nr:SHOCT domain-containing protein [Propionibacteriaceae bacterium]